jgi:hypothetical protein
VKVVWGVNEGNDNKHLYKKFGWEEDESETAGLK